MQNTSKYFNLSDMMVEYFNFENKEDKSSKNKFFTFLLFAGIFTAFATVSYFPNRFLMQKGKIFAKIAINFQYPIRLLAPASFFIIFATLECLEKSQLLKNSKGPAIHLIYI